MGFIEEEKQTAPPPRWWPAAQKKNAHGIGVYASYEKGTIENRNRLVRRWHSKGTDFNRLTRRKIQQLKEWINSIHRESLNGETAHAYD